MNLRNNIKRILQEELGDTKSRYERQTEILTKLIKLKSYEGVCGVSFVESGLGDRIRTVVLTFSSDWWNLANFNPRDFKEKSTSVYMTKKDVQNIAYRFLRLENILVTSLLAPCDWE